MDEFMNNMSSPSEVSSKQKKVEQIGNYLLSHKIGTGGMAEVYLAKHQNKPQLQFALKRILTKHSSNEELLKMFIQEASLASILNHPNITQIYDFGCINGHYFIAMEFIDGIELKALLKKCIVENNTIPIPIAIFIIIQVLDALHFAHQKCDQYQRPLQIIHRDVSPQNIMISNSGQVKVLDFGIAKAMAKPGVAEEEKGSLKGKFSYMSPEQALGKRFDQTTDVFATAIVFWEMLTLHSCYEARNQQELLSKVRSADITPPHIVNSNIPLKLSKIIMKALAKKEKNRFSNALEFSNDLKHFLFKHYGMITQEDISNYLRQTRSIKQNSEHQNKTSYEVVHSNKIKKINHNNQTSNNNLKMINPWLSRFQQKKYYFQFIFKLFFLSCLVLSTYPCYIFFKNLPTLNNSNIQSMFKNKISKSTNIEKNLNSPNIILSKNAQKELETLDLSTVYKIQALLKDVQDNQKDIFAEDFIHVIDSGDLKVTLALNNEKNSLDILNIE